MKCSNIHCEHYDEGATHPCAECAERERMTETPELRDKKERIEKWRRHKEHNKKGGEDAN